MEANSQSGGSPELRAIAKRTRKNQIGTGLTKVTEPQNPLNLPRPNSCKEEMCLALRALMPCNFQIHPRADLNMHTEACSDLHCTKWVCTVGEWLQKARKSNSHGTRGPSGSEDISHSVWVTNINKSRAKPTVKRRWHLASLSGVMSTWSFRFRGSAAKARVKIG